MLSARLNGGQRVNPGIVGNEVMFLLEDYGRGGQQVCFGSSNIDK
jgi:hypothetical protein